MSEPTIYQINPMTITSGESGHKVVICKGRYLGVLEPMEPDYEAAALTYQIVEGTAIGHGLMPAVKAIVDAALRIGGSDE